MNNKDKVALLLISLYAGILLLFAFAFNGTGDEGDSVTHYLIAKYAFQNPGNFLDHWGKPLYTLLAAPFCQFGFKGVKVFNIINSVLTLVFTYKIAQKLNFKYPLVAILMLAVCRNYFILTLSGLTEPLCAMLLSLVIWQILRGNLITALLVASFLPFVRSEGLILCGVIGIYLLFVQKYKYIPLLLTGHIIYGLIGLVIKHNFLWVITEIPYATTKSIYGRGNWFDYIINLPAMMGVPLTILLSVGIIYSFRLFIFPSAKEGKSSYYYEKLFLIYGTFIAFLIFHSVSWQFGLFKSFGLLRVFNAIMPVMVIISLYGFESFLALFKPESRRIILIPSIVLIVVLSVFNYNYGLFKATYYELTSGQILCKKVGEYLNSNSAHLQSTNVYFTAPYLSETLNISEFNNPFYHKLYDLKFSDAPLNSIVIWDDWFSVVDDRTSWEELAGSNKYKLEQTFEIKEPGNKGRKMALFRRI